MPARLARGPVLFAVALLAALAAAVLLSRRSGESADAGAHAGQGVASAADSAAPVFLRPAEEHRIGVTYAVALPEALTRDVRIVGQVAADETRITAVSLKVDGWVERLYVDFIGREVRTGEPLLELYSPMVASAAEELLLAHRLLAEVGGDSSEAAANARSLVASARRRLAWWDVPAAQIRRIEETGEAPRTVTLRAPFTGVVLEKDVVPGQTAMAGQPLFRLADLAVVWVEGEVFEQDLPLVRVGQPVEAEFTALPGTVRTGRIVYVYPTVDEATRTARVRVELPNGRRDLKPGMYATLRVTVRQARQELTVPRSAVLSTGTRSLVFKRLPGGRLEPREVRVGLASDSRVQVLDGLAAGDTVVASGTFLVDAESNLGAVLGGMGDMPGMDMAPPVPLLREVPVQPQSAPPSRGEGTPTPHSASGPHAGQGS
ncbi:MAG TPA: efflux RND transporter periplasmic adaptor subunit [Gemmatimonadales bacterium]|nr:efflux RND transporter periplasmic adaptor subunit [Gemmatimonadales bacterium]